jgi:hypothetical protein
VVRFSQGSPTYDPGNQSSLATCPRSKPFSTKRIELAILQALEIETHRFREVRGYSAATNEQIPISNQSWKQFHNGTADDSGLISTKNFVRLESVPILPGARAANLFSRSYSAGAVGKHDVGDPILKNRALLWVEPFEFKPHAEGSVAVDHLGFGVEGAFVAHDFDRDSRPNSKRCECIDVASAETDFGGAGDKFGPSTGFHNLDRGHEGYAFYGAFFGEFSCAPATTQSRLFAVCQHSIPCNNMFKIMQLQPTQKTIVDMSLPACFGSDN